MNNKKIKWKRYFFEFLSIFIGVSMAFALNKWNEDRRDSQSEQKTLMEIRNGLELDLSDLKHNIAGHDIGIKACNYFRTLIDNQEIDLDTFTFQFHHLLRDYITIQNKSGYESLKSHGLELISNDSLRLEIISLYGFHYEVIQKLEEEYNEMQFYDNYYEIINETLAAYLIFDENGELAGINQPIELTNNEKNKILISLWQIEKNRKFTKDYYVITIEKVKNLILNIDKEFEN